jgi:hypothetical protein
MKSVKIDINFISFVLEWSELSIKKLSKTIKILIIIEKISKNYLFSWL